MGVWRPKRSPAHGKFENKRARRAAKRRARGSGLKPYRDHRLERFESRMMLAGPQLLSIIPNVGDVILEGDIRHVSPRELVFRFDQAENLDPFTVASTQITAQSGFSIADGQTFTIDGRVFEFDRTGGTAAGNIPVSYTLLSTAAQVAASMAQAINDAAFGVQARAEGNRVRLLGAQTVNAAPLAVSEHSAFRIERSGSNRDPVFGNGNDVLLVPGFLGIGQRDNEVVFRFREDLPDDFYRITIIGAGPDALMSRGHDDEPGEPFNNGFDKQIRFRLDLGPVVTAVVPMPIVRLGGSLFHSTNTIEIYFNHDDLDLATVGNTAFYQLINTRGTADPSDDEITLPHSAVYDPDFSQSTAGVPLGGRVVLTFSQPLTALGTGTYRLRIGTDEDPLPPPTIVTLSTDPGDTWTTAHNLGSFDLQMAINGEILVDPSVNPYGVIFPGGVGNPGHRDIPVAGNNHLDSAPADKTPTIPTLAYNFKDIYGYDPVTGLPLHNLITEVQKERAREIFELWGRYLGVQFVETAESGFTIVTGDTRVLAPLVPPDNLGGIAGNNMAIMNGAIDWGRSEYGGRWFFTAFHEIGHLLGLTHTYDLPPLTVMGQADEFSPQPGQAEPVFPGDHDIVHGQYLYRPDSRDIDLYTFVVNQAGVFTAEIIAERRSRTNPTDDVLDSVLTLYNELNVLLLPATGGAAIGDGQRFTVSDGTTTVTFEFDSNGVVTPGNVAIPFTAATSMRDLSVAVAEAINDTAINVQAEFGADRVVLIGPVTVSGLTAPAVRHRIERAVIAQNDDYYSKDSFLELDLKPGRYYLGVSSKGNTQYNPNSPDSGYGGTTEGPYQLRLGHRPSTFSSLVDATGQALDGDADGLAGGVFNFWFQVGNTIYVDKVAGPGGDGSLLQPFDRIDLALATAANRIVVPAGGGAAIDDGDLLVLNFTDGITPPLVFEFDSNSSSDPAHIPISFLAADSAQDLAQRIFSAIENQISGGAFLGAGYVDVLAPVTVDRSGTPGLFNEPRIVRILANPGTDGDLRTPGDAVPYLLGRDLFGPLADGDTMDIPQGVTVMIDAGAVLKLRDTNIDAGRSSPTIDRSRGALQVLGAPGRSVVFTSFHDDTAGGISDAPNVSPNPGDWGGLVFRDESDLEQQAIFLNYVSWADLRYGGGQIVVDSVRSIYNPIHLETARPTIINNRIRFSADAAISADPNSFEDSRLADPSLALDYQRVGPHIRDNTIIDNSLNGIFVRILTPAGDHRLALERPARFDDADIVHIIADTLLIRGTPGGGLETSPRLDARLAIDPGLIVKLQGASIETLVGGQLIAEGLPGLPVIFTSLRDDRYGTAGAFDTNNDGGITAVNRGDWGGLAFGPASSASIDHAILAYGGGDVTIEGGFARFNVLEIRQADVRLTNSYIAHNADGLDASNRNGRLRNQSATVFVRGAQPVIVNNIFDDNQGATIHINVNALHSFVRPDPGRSRGLANRFEDFAANAGPLVRLNRIGNDVRNTAINGMVIRGGTLTTQGVWDDPDIVHVLLDEVVIDNVHTYGGLRIQSSPTESLVVKLNGNTAGITASGHPQDISDRLGGVLHVVGLPGKPVIFTSLGDDTVGAGLQPNGQPQNNTDNTAGAGAGTAGPVFIDGGDRDDHGQFNSTTGENEDGWKFIEQALNFTYSNSLNVGATNILVIGADPGTKAADAIISAATVLGLPAPVFVNDNEIAAVDFTQFRVMYIPSVNNADDLGGSGVQGGISNAEIAILTNRKQDVQDYVNITGGGLMALTQAGAPQAYAWLELPLPFVIDTNITGGRLVQTPLLAAAGFNITDEELNNGTPWHNEFIGPPGFNNLEVWVTSISGEIVTLGLPAGSAGIGAPPPNWRSLRIETYGSDRNVAVVNEFELSVTGGNGTNDAPATAQFLGQLAPHEKSGDDVLRLGFQIHGSIAVDAPTDMDVYSFRATAGTEVWIDIDRTSPALDTVVELVNQAGSVLARSDNSFFEEQATLNSLLPGNLARPFERDAWADRDHYTTNLKDAGFRVVLPGTLGSINTYYVRVRSRGANISDLAGLTSGVYQLQIRLREVDEFPGSVIDTSEIRFATNGVEIVGMPARSPLLSEAGETSGLHGSFDTAQDLGNLLVSDRATINVGGRIDDRNQVDWYVFTVDFNYIQAIQEVNAGRKTWSTIFDIDYADGLVRPDLILSVYDASGTLIYVGRDSDIADDRPAPNQGHHLNDLSRLSVGGLDPFIGSVHLPEENGQRYFVAVHSNAIMPDVLNYTLTANATQPLARLEPIGSVRRIVEDHIGHTGFTSGDPTVNPLLVTDVQPTTESLLPINSAEALALHVRPLVLGDVVLYASTVDAFGGSQLHLYNPSSGEFWATQGSLPDRTQDLAIRTDGRMFIYQNLIGTANTGGEVDEVNFATLAVTNNVARDNLSDTVAATDAVDAFAYRRTGRDAAGAPIYDLWYSVAFPGDSQLSILVGPGVTQPAFMESGFVFYGAPRNSGETRRPLDPATDTSLNFTALDLTDGETFTIDDGVNPPVVFEFNSGPQITVLADGDDDADADSNVDLEGVTFRVTLSGAVSGSLTFELTSDTNYTAQFPVAFASTDSPAAIANAIAIAINSAVTQTFGFAWVNATAAGHRATVGSPNPLLGISVTPISVPASPPTLDIQNFSNQVTPGRVRVHFEADDTADQIATAMAEAINAVDAQLNSTASVERDARGVYVAVQFASAVSETVDGMVVGGEGPGGRITGLAWVGDTLYAVSRNGGFYTVNTLNGSLNYLDGDDSLWRTDGLRFEALTIGPQNLDFDSNGVGGDLANTLFAYSTARGGELVALRDSGVGSNRDVRFAAFDTPNNVLVMPLAGGAAISEGQGFALSSGGPATAFVFDFPGGTDFTETPVLRVISINSTTTQQDLANAVAAAINAAPGLGVTATALADGVVMSLPVQVLGITASAITLKSDGVLEPAIAMPAPPSVGEIRGLAFSPLDFNLWHPTTRRGLDPGHGINPAPDLSRNPEAFETFVGPDGTQFNQATGGASFYFGLENFQINAPTPPPFFSYGTNQGQYGVRDDLHLDLASNPAIRGTYNLPGGAYGSLVTRPFSLEGYKTTDKPTLYFNYFLSTEGFATDQGDMRDSARVWISTDGGATWPLFVNTPSTRTTSLLATNNLQLDAELPEFLSVSATVPSTDLRQQVQPLFNTGGGWRQARIDLSNFAGMTNLVLRFDFSTAGTVLDRTVGDRAFADTTLPYRAQNNSFEGFYIDDIIIGLTERGEMVTGATPNVSVNTRVPSDPNGPQQILTGPYQLEIRRGHEFAVLSTETQGNVVYLLDQIIDSNDRITTDWSLTVPGLFQQTQTATDPGTTFTRTFTGLPAPTGAGTLTVEVVGDLEATNESLTIDLDGQVTFTGQLATSGEAGRLAMTRLPLTLAQLQNLTANGTIVATVTRTAAVSGIREIRLRLEYAAVLDGQFFQVSNGVNVVTFEFNVTGGVAEGRTPINLNGTENAAQLAAAVAQAINTHTLLGTNPHAPRRVFAASYASGGRVDLFGAANVVTTGAPSLSAQQYRPIADHALTRAIGDRNLPRVQGQVMVRNSRIVSPSQNGIVVTAAPREAGGSIPHPGAVQNTSVLNSERLVPGITLMNNLIVGLPTTGVGIFFGGDPDPNNLSSVPFGRIVNNTIVGSTGTQPRGTGIEVANRAGPTLLNNIVAWTSTGINVSSDSLNNTVIGATLYQGNGRNTALEGGTFALPQTFAEVLSNTAALFLDRQGGNLYLAPGTRAIDSSVNSLPDRPALTVVTGPMGIAPSPILAPDYDLLGQLRVDDPTVAPPPGLGANVFKDRGALERADNTGPNAVLLQPLDNDSLDQDRTNLQTVHYVGRTLSEFAIQLVEGVGSGVDDRSVEASRVRVRQNGRLLTAGLDYFFAYDGNNDIIRLIAGAGIWLPGNVYTVSLDNGVVFDTVPTPVGIVDLAGNKLQHNLPSGATQFTIILDELQNNAPVISAPINISLAEDTQFVFNPNVAPFIGVQIFDVDAGLALIQLTLSANQGTLSLGSLAGLNFSVGDGVSDPTMTFTGTLAAINNALVGLTYRPVPDYHGPDLIQVIANDLGNSGVPFQPKTGSATIIVNVTPVNDPPIVLNPIPDVTVIENALPSTLSLATTFFDVDGDPLTLSVVANSNPTLVTTSLVGTTLTLTYRPKLSGTAVITVRAQDPGGLFVTDTFVVTVTPVNDPPFLVTPIPNVTVNEDAPPTFINLASHFSDPDLPGDVLTFSVRNNTNPLVVSTAIIGSQLRLTYLPDRHGVLQITVRATDQANAFAETTFTVTVNPVNDAPVPGNDNYFFEVNRPLVVTAPGVLMNDTDVDNDPLRAVLFDVPRHGQLALNADGSFIYNPDTGFNGIDTFQYRVDDGSVRATATVRLLSLDARWVMRLYAEVLGRTTTPSDAEVLFWTGELARGRSRGDVAQGFINSVERRSREINNFYQLYLGRGVDPSGLQFWLQVWAANNGPEPVQAGLLGSMEYFINRGGGTNAGFVQALYNDVLGRSAGPAEVAFWVNELATRSRANVAMGFLVSDEYRLKVIANMYTTYLRRPIDNDGAQYWLQRMKQGVPQESILAGILGSLEYYNLA
ncbi:MAG: tandem-95 repeat protein [Pirellulales bacterium]|nr:tandem-95 repeat protein [Pirellulales bacterium]